MDDLCEILGNLKERRPDTQLPEGEDRARLGRLVAFCPVYRDYLRKRPELVPWLCTQALLPPLFKAAAFARMREDPLFSVPDDVGLDRKKSSLRLFRRAMSLRIAFRDMSDLADSLTAMRELTALAEYILAQGLEIVRAGCVERFGTPWDEEADAPARFSVFALGKLGSGELNFMSDLDLIYVFDGRGSCRKNARATAIPNEVFFGRLANDYTAFLQERTGDGFLYNIDLRLRPEGNDGPVVCSAAAMENYYYSSGQTWERLALMKARNVAGDVNLGGELLETLSPFRFPRTPPPSLFDEVAGLKIRIEHEVLGEENFKRDIKNGWGGIREIEFLVQALQCVYHGRYPFLQTPSTLTALAGLERYQILSLEEANLLAESYMWLRRVEHRLQMREEEQTQTLPAPGSDARAFLAVSLGMRTDEFEAKMDAVRKAVRGLYENYFPISSKENLVQEWTEFIGGEKPGPQINALIDAVFWGPRDPVEEGLRRLALGGGMSYSVTRETVQLMIDLSGNFRETLAPQAHPLRTLARVNEYADRYGARKSFLRLCAGNPQFFYALCMLFDRSEFIHRLVCAHPEILEELMMTSALRLNKPGRIMRREIRALETNDDETTAQNLWLWIKAEQVRMAMAQVLSKVNLERVEFTLSRMASVAVGEMLRRVDPEGELIVVAMGKFGAREMSFGSDLDMMIVCAGAATEAMTRKVLRLNKIMGYKGPLGTGLDVDMRLRPYGDDGPLVVALPSLEYYHDGHGGELWERQAMLRCRPISDRSDARAIRETTAEAFMTLREKLLFSMPPPEDLMVRVAAMRNRIEQEKTKNKKPERCIKAGPGGILDVEFIAQAKQMKCGYTHKELRGQNTRDTLRTLLSLGILPKTVVEELLVNYELLRTVEFRLRREHNTPVTSIDEDSDTEHSIARWTNFKDFPSLLDELKKRMSGNRRFFNEYVAPL
jgi:[glutamine synthetase] adenylyltransferase / [glutamine synthetase]-adenylyl-L-tyrosine phosphorylase